MNPGAGSRSRACSEAAAAQPRTARPGRPLAPPSSAAASAPPARAFVRSQQTLRHLKATLARSPSPECGATCQACGRHPGLAGTGPGWGRCLGARSPGTPGRPRRSRGAVRAPRWRPRTAWCGVNAARLGTASASSGGDPQRGTRNWGFLGQLRFFLIVASCGP